MVRSWDECVDLGHGRGRAERSTAEAVWRIDADLGRPADVNEAWRSPEQANANRARWLAYERYLNGGPWAPWAPYALGAEDSVHCDGEAVDSDDWYNPAAAAVWRRHGFRQTARYPGTARDEIWHGEHRDEWEEPGARPAGGNATPIQQKEWYEMALDDQAKADIRDVFREVLNEPRGKDQNQTSANIAFITAQVKGEVDETQPDRGEWQLATAIRSIAKIKGWLSFTRVKVHSIWARTLGRDPRAGISPEDLAALDRIDGKPGEQS